MRQAHCTKDATVVNPFTISILLPQVTEDMASRFFAPLPLGEELQLPRGDSDDRAKL